MNPKLSLPAALIAAFYMTSCTWSDPVQVENDFGQSVRHMVEQQTKHPETTRAPKTYEPTGLDGDTAVNGLDRYRAAQKRKLQRESLNSFEEID